MDVFDRRYRKICGDGRMPDYGHYGEEIRDSGDAVLRTGTGSSKNALVYVPVQNKALVEKMKKLLTADEIEALIAGMPEYTVEWIDADTVRAESYRAILSGGDRRALIGLIRTLYERQKELKEKHRHLRSADEQILKTAENMINDEFAAVLGITPEDVVPYIMGKLTE